MYFYRKAVQNTLMQKDGHKIFGEIDTFSQFHYHYHFTSGFFDNFLTAKNYKHKVLEQKRCS